MKTYNNMENRFDTVLQDIEAGRKIIRSEGINFSEFIKRLRAVLLFERGNDFTQDTWIWHYDSYAGCRGRENVTTTVEEWAQEYFSHWTISENGIQLKK